MLRSGIEGCLRSYRGNHIPESEKTSSLSLLPYGHPVVTEVPSHPQSPHCLLLFFWETQEFSWGPGRQSNPMSELGLPVHPLPRNQWLGTCCSVYSFSMSQPSSLPSIPSFPLILATSNKLSTLDAQGDNHMHPDPLPLLARCASPFVRFL